MFACCCASSITCLGLLLVQSCLAWRTAWLPTCQAHRSRWVSFGLHLCPRSRVPLSLNNYVVSSQALHDHALLPFSTWGLASGSFDSGMLASLCICLILLTLSVSMVRISTTTKPARFPPTLTPVLVCVSFFVLFLSDVLSGRVIAIFQSQGRLETRVFTSGRSGWSMTVWIAAICTIQTTNRLMIIPTVWSLGRSLMCTTDSAGHLVLEADPSIKCFGDNTQHWLYVAVRLCPFLRFHTLEKESCRHLT